MNHAVIAYTTPPKSKVFTSGQRWTEIMSFRPLLIDAISAAYPDAVEVGHIFNTTRIKEREMNLDELNELLQHLMEEGIVLLVQEADQRPRYKFNYEDCKCLPHNADKRLPPPTKDKHKEPHCVKRLRLLQRRAKEGVKRQNQFDKDVRKLLSIVNQQPTLATPFSAHQVMPYLPEYWKRDKHRYEPSYIMLCLLHLLQWEKMKRDESTGHFYRYSGGGNGKMEG